MTSDYSHVLAEARGICLPIVVTIDGDEYTVEWSECADDGSGYGTPGWADENGMHVLEEDFEYARFQTDDD